MKFEDALAAMRVGKKVKRKNWPFPWGLNPVLSIYSDDLSTCESLSDGDMDAPDIMAEDWEIVDA